MLRALLALRGPQDHKALQEFQEFPASLEPALWGHLGQPGLRDHRVNPGSQDLQEQ